MHPDPSTYLRSNLTLKESVKGLHLAELTPYIKQFTNAHVVNGQLTSQGDVAVKLGGSAPEITFQWKF